jgi:hypothetical protein
MGSFCTMDLQGLVGVLCNVSTSAARMSATVSFLKVIVAACFRPAEVLLLLLCLPPAVCWSRLCFTSGIVNSQPNWNS